MVQSIPTIVVVLLDLFLLLGHFVEVCVRRSVAILACCDHHVDGDGLLPCPVLDKVWCDRHFGVFVALEEGIGLSQDATACGVAGVLNCRSHGIMAPHHEPAAVSEHLHRPRGGASTFVALRLERWYSAAREAMGQAEAAA